MYAFHVTVKRMYTGKSFLENAPWIKTSSGVHLRVKPLVTT
jgi:hypothetical protein